jgi:hypothetical protein
MAMTGVQTTIQHGYRRVGGAGLAAAVLIGAVEVADVLSTWSDWHRYQAVRDFVDGKAIVDDLSSADQTSSTTGWAYLIMLLAAAAVFLVWLWRARANAELRSPARHRRSRGWVIGAWICPVVNFWFPYQIVDDVYRASRPDNLPDLMDLRSVPGSPRIGTWWTLWLGSLLANRIAVQVVRGDRVDVESWRSLAIISTVGTALSIGAAAMMVLIMRQISQWQDTPALAPPVS